MWPILLLVPICVCAENWVNLPIKYDWIPYTDRPLQPQRLERSSIPQYFGYHSGQDIEHQNAQDQMETIDQPSIVPMDTTVSSICENKSKKMLAVWEVVSQLLGISGDRKVTNLVELKRLSVIFKTFLTISRDKDFNSMSIGQVLNTIEKRLNYDDLSREGVDIPKIDGHVKPENLIQDSSIEEGINGEENEFNYVKNVGSEEAAPKGNLNLLQMFANEPSKIDYPRSRILALTSIIDSYKKFPTLSESKNTDDTDSENNMAHESIIGSIDERDFENDAKIPYIVTNNNRGNFLTGELPFNKISKISSILSSPTGSEPNVYSVTNEAAYLDSPIMPQNNALLFDFSSPTTNTEDDFESDVNSLKTLTDNSGIPIPDWPIDAEFKTESESMINGPISNPSFEEIKASTVFPIDNIFESLSKDPEIIGLAPEQTAFVKESWFQQSRPSLPTSETSKQSSLRDEANAFKAQFINEQKQNDRSLLTPITSRIEEPFDEALSRTVVEPYIKESDVNFVHDYIDYNPEYSAGIVNSISFDYATRNTEFAPDNIIFGNELKFAPPSNSYIKWDPIEEETTNLGVGYNHNSNGPIIHDEYSLEPTVTPINEGDAESQSFLDKEDSIPVDYNYISWTTNRDDDSWLRNELRDKLPESTLIWQHILSHYTRYASCPNSRIVSLLIELKASLDALESEVCE